MLQKVGSFNDVPKEMLPTPLKRGEVVVYQFVTGVPNPVPKGDVNRGPDIIYNSVIRIPTRDRIRLPDGRIIEIGVVEEFKDDVVLRTRRLFIMAQQNGGYFYVTGGEIESEQFYPYLELCNHNESNPHRDQNVAPLFKRVDELEDAKKYLKIGDAIATATGALNEMSVAELRQLAASLNMDSQMHETLLKGTLMKLAVEQPDKLIKLISDPETALKALVKRAKEMGVISYVETKKKFVWSTGQIIAKLDLVEGKDDLDLMADWLVSHKNGTDVTNKIKSLVKKEAKEAKAKGE